MENKIIVEKGTFEYNDKEYSSYFIAGKIKGKDVKVALMPPDKGGWAVLDILFSDTNQGELVVKPYELKDEKTGKVTATGNTYAVRTVDENGEIYECPVKPFKSSDKALLNTTIRNILRISLRAKSRERT